MECGKGMDFTKGIQEGYCMDTTHSLAYSIHHMTQSCTVDAP